MSLQGLIVKKMTKLQISSENILNWIDDSTESSTEVSPRYQSKYSSATKEFYNSTKKPHGTMGYAKTPLKSTKEYLRKHTRDSNKIIETKPFTCLNENNKKPPIPKQDEVPLLHKTPNKDFIKLNALSVMKTPALRPAPKSVDTRRGDSFLLEFSGLVPKFLRKKEFGKIPKYLVQRKKDLEYSRKMFEKSKEAKEEHKFIVLSEEEKSNLKQGLRAKWEELNTLYLKLPLIIDTNFLVKRKETLEKNLNSLERDMDFLERNKDVDIYVLPE